MNYINDDTDDFAKEKELLKKQQWLSPEDLKKEPYIIKQIVTYERMYNKDFGDDVICKCGHPYYRHFDTYDDMATLGCKYCGCYTFRAR